MKNIYETLAALGTGAILLAGCAASTPPAATADVPAATETTPVEDKSAPSEQKSGDEAAAASPNKDSANMAASPAEATPAAASTSAPASTAAPSTSAAPVKSATKPAAKKTGTTAKKKDAAGSCGEGTCG